MSTPIAILVSILGLALLYFGGNVLVNGAVTFSRICGIPPFIIGITIVAFGTSAPEFFVSILAAFNGYEAVSLGNLLGSNVINMAFILGLGSIVMPVTTARTAIRFDFAVLGGAYLLLWIMGINFSGNGAWYQGSIMPIEGVILLLIVGAYVVYRVRTIKNGKTASNTADLHTSARGASLSSSSMAPSSLSKRSDTADGSASAPSRTGSETRLRDSVSYRVIFSLIKIAAGIALLVVGGQILVDGAVWLADEVFMISQRVIGITIVALGTSLPELFVTIIAGIRGNSDISVGNIVGSNIFNTMLVPAIPAMVGGLSLSSADFRLDFAAIGVTTGVVAIAVMFRERIGRLSGAILLGCYGIYIWLLLM